MLTKGQVALVDPAVFMELNQVKWFATWDQHSKSYYAARRVGPQGQQKFIALHNAVMQPGPGQTVDHINHITLDNRRSHMRIGTKSQNAANRRFPRKSSRFKGVSWDKRRQVWYAGIKVDKRSRNLGYFENEIDAAHAYDNAALESWGKFAQLNFPKEK